MVNKSGKTWKQIRKCCKKGCPAQVVRYDESERGVHNLELWCSWLSHLLYTQKVLGSNPSSSIFIIFASWTGRAVAAARRTSTNHQLRSPRLLNPTPRKRSPCAKCSTSTRKLNPSSATWWSRSLTSNPKTLSASCSNIFANLSNCETTKSKWNKNQNEMTVFSNGDWLGYILIYNKIDI